MKFRLSLSALVFLLVLFLASPVLAWFGAGNSAGWPNASDGLTGRLLSPFPLVPPSSYSPGYPIALNFQVSNPTGNSQSVNKPIYLKTFRVVVSPRGRSLDPGTADATDITESELYSNNRSGNDYQTLLATYSLGNLNLSPGQQSVFSFTPTFSDDGYYQLDLTDLSSSQTYSPGHIYVALFIRVKRSSSAGSSGGGSGSGGGGPTAPVCADPVPNGAPELVSATSINNNNSVTLIWTPAPDPVTYYLVTYGTSPGAQTYGNPNVGGHDTTSYIVSGLSGGVTYYFRVRAGNGCTPGPYSNELSATPRGGQVLGPALGFTLGVLGAASPSTGKATSSAAGGETKGAATPTTVSCQQCVWWPLLIAELIILSLLYIFGKDFSRKRIAFGAIAGLFIYFLFLFVNRACLTGTINLILFSLPCKLFWLLDGILFCLLSLLYYLFLGRKLSLKGGQIVRTYKRSKRK